MRFEGEGFYDLGPALLYDVALADRLRTPNDGEWHDDAIARRCVVLENEGIRQFEGRIEVLVDEPPPPHTSWAKERVLGLGLDAPSGTLTIDAAYRLIDNGAAAPTTTKEPPILAGFAVPPGSYAVDLYGYLAHEVRVELEGIPGEPPMSTRWQWMQRLAGLGVLLTIIGIFFLVAAVKTSSTLLALGTGAAIVAMWVGYALAYRATGASAEDNARAARVAAYIATLPPIPDLTIVLRRVEVAPEKGGGIAY